MTDVHEAFCDSATTAKERHLYPVEERNISYLISDIYQRCGESARVGRFLCFFSLGWLNIEDGGDYWSVMWTSNKDYHSILAGRPAIVAEFRKSTGDRNTFFGLSGAYKSAISMWPVRDKEEADRIFTEVTRHIKNAHRHNC